MREATPDGGVKVTTTEQLATGGPSHATYTYKYDGKEYPATGGPDGKYHQTGRIVVSKDGKTMTQTFKGTDPDGKLVHGTNVYDKQ